MRCFWRDWLYFDDSEEQDDAEWEHDKEREADEVNEADGQINEQNKEGNDGTIFSEDFRKEEIRGRDFPQCGLLHEY